MIKGILNNVGKRLDVDREYIMYLDSVDEGHSLLTSENLQKCGDPGVCQALFDAEDEDFMVR